MVLRALCPWSLRMISTRVTQRIPAAKNRTSFRPKMLSRVLHLQMNPEAFIAPLPALNLLI